MKNLTSLLLNIFNFREKNSYMTISELKAHNINEEKIEKQRRFRAYISEINQRYNNMRTIEQDNIRKVS